MKSKIALTFDKCRKAKRPALITYTVAGEDVAGISLSLRSKNIFFSLNLETNSRPPLA